MAPLEEIPLVPLASNCTYPAVNDQTIPVNDGYRGSQRYYVARPLKEGNQPYPVDPMRQLTEDLAHILYYNRHEEMGPSGGRVCTDAHKDFDGGPLIAQYEPCSPMDPKQLKVILTHLRPIVKTTGDATLTGLYEFVKTLLIMKKAWFKAAGGFFGLLAYMDMLETWSIDGGGLSFPGQHGAELIQWQLGKTQDKHENTWNALQAFKSAPAFLQNIRQLHVWFAQLKVEHQECRKRTEEALKKANEANRKRREIKMRNEQVIRQQMGQGAAHMGIGRQMYMVETMSNTIRRAMELTEDEKKDGRWA